MIELRPAKYLLGRLVPMDNNDKIPLFNLGSGTYDNTKFLRGDGTWAVPSGGGGSYVPYTGAIGNVDLGEYGLSAGWLQIDTTPTTYTAGVGKLGWSSTDGTLEFKLLGGNVTLQIGQEQVARVVNKTDPLIDLLESNYQVVKIGGAQGNRLKVALAQANNDANSAETLGVVTETILKNQEGFITTSGIIHDINTTGSLQGETWADGDMLFLSGTIAGQMTKVKPSAPIHTVILGYVIRAHATQGQIYVKIDNGYELGELHDVNTTVSKTTPIDADSVLLQDTADSDIWKKLSWANIKATLKTYFDTLYQAAGSYVPTSRTLTINSTTQDLSTNRSWTIDKTSVGLGNVDNTSDVDKPVSTAQATAIALKEDAANKTTDLAGNSTSNIKFPTVKAIYDWATGLFQSILVSGTNIKTINGSSVLGSGNLTITASASVKKIAVQSSAGTLVIASTSNTISSSVLIPANTIPANCVMDLSFMTERPISGSATTTCRAYLNTSNSLTGATLLMTGQITTTSITGRHIRQLSVNGSTWSIATAANILTSDLSYSANALTTFTLATNQDLYLIIAMQNSNLTTTSRSSYASLISYE